MNADRRTTFTSPWLAGLVLGAVNGAAALSLGILILPLFIASVLLIAWKGPRLVAIIGFVTGAGLIWTTLFARLALTCGGPLDSGAQGMCVAGALTGWIAFAAAIFTLGLVGSALMFRRLRS